MERYAFKAPEDTIAVAPQSISFAYCGHDDQGREILSVFIDDRRLGTVMLALQPAQAQHVAFGLLGMLNQLDQLRRDYDHHNNKGA